nr:unnamed protein product [Spirometra erinaceieuropaei]
MRIRSSILLQAALIFLGDIFAHAEQPSTYKLCKRQLSEKITAFYCETPEEPCTLYDVYGRPDYPRNFERHVLCVQACQFVAQVEQSTATSFKLCRDVQQRCSPIEKKNGTFNDFRKCIFQCDGWVKLENTKENTAYLCPASGDCQQGNYFTKKNEAGAFASLKACFETCMSGEVPYALQLAIKECLILVSET